MVDEDMMTAFGILKNSLDLLKVSKQPLMRSPTKEAADALRLVECIIPQIQDELDKSARLRAVYSEFAEDDEEYPDPRRSPGLSAKLSKRKSMRNITNRRPQLPSDTSNVSSKSTKSSKSNSIEEPKPTVKGVEDDDVDESIHQPAPLISSKEQQSLSLKEQSEIYDLALKAQEAFMILDKDHSGYLDVSELREAFKSIPPDKLDDMIAEMHEMNDDESGNLQVHIGEFVEMFTQKDNGSFVDMRPAITDITNDLIKEHNQRNKDQVRGDDFLLDPRGFFSVQWDLLIALLLMTTVFTMPLSMAFKYFEDALFPLDLMADFLFVLDVVKHFWTGYIDEFDYTIMVAKEVRTHYMGTWFVPDVLSSIPVEIINLIFTSGLPSFLRASRILKLLRLSRLTKVFRLMKITKLGKLVIEAKEAFEDRFRVQIPEAFLILGRLWMSLLVLAHWVGCINFMVVRLYDFPEESWVVFADLVHVPINIQYSWCFFKALAQLIGVGFDIPPIVNTSCLERTEWCTVEHWITLTCLYIGSVYVALLISSISYVIVNMNKGSSNLSMQLWTLNEYLSNKKVPYEVRDRVRNFYRIRFAEGKMYNEEEVLGLLPPNLRDDILSHNQRLLFEQVPLLSSDKDSKKTDKNMHALRARLAPMLEKRVMFQHEDIFEEGSLGSEIFFIVSGIVEICSDFVEAIPGEKGVVKSISDGCYFGDVAVLLGIRRTASTRARTNLVLSVISKDEITQVLSEFPQVKNYMMSIAENRRDRLFSLDPESVDILNDDQLVDVEDSQTKYFVKLTNVNRQDTFFHPTLARSNSRGTHRSLSDQELLEDLEDAIELAEEEGGSSFDDDEDVGKGVQLTQYPPNGRKGLIRPTAVDGRGVPIMQTINSGDALEDRYETPPNAQNPLLNKSKVVLSTSPTGSHLSPLARPNKKKIRFRNNDSQIPESYTNLGGEEPYNGQSLNGKVIYQEVDEPLTIPPTIAHSGHGNHTASGGRSKLHLSGTSSREPVDDEVKSSSLDRAP